ncbi:M12 family metallopeptidase [Actinoplanes sp. NPDC049118]|uniref:M12 family metallopeptidase n=1 Tax=Actinoplanes sp. NPDC049118 TaxID=3155769 RepID=UPI00340DC68A
MDRPICEIKMLPPERWAAAARDASGINPANAPSLDMLRLGATDVAIAPLHAALLTAKYWGARGVQLTVGFMEDAAADLRARILSHMNAWGQWANVTFAETATDPQVRIAMLTGEDGGYWSYVGTDILGVAADEPTMNLEGFTMDTPESEFVRVVRHEAGHTLGFPHEHMRKEIVDRIDPESAIRYFMERYGWNREKVISNVLTPLPMSALLATAEADSRSIMCYWLPASIMKDAMAVEGGLDVSPQDAQFVAQLYPIATPSAVLSPERQS